MFSHLMASKNTVSYLLSCPGSTGLRTKRLFLRSSVCWGQITNHEPTNQPINQSQVDWQTFQSVAYFSKWMDQLGSRTEVKGGKRRPRLQEPQGRQWPRGSPRLLVIFRAPSSDGWMDA